MNDTRLFGASPRPNLFIVGAAKCGTTSLYHYLGQHPEIFMLPVKEPEFFSDKLARPPDIATYRSYFAGVGEEKIIGEASTSYLIDPKVPDRLIRALGNDLKIIISLRNPIDMMHAWWGDCRKNGFEPLDFEAALAAETFRMTDTAFGAGHQTHTEAGWRRAFAYRYRARYCDHVGRYLDAFGRGQVNVLIFEDFFPNARARIRGLYEFLGVDPTFVPELAPRNEATAARLFWLQRLMRVRNPLRDVARQVLPYRMRDRIYGLVYRYNQRPAQRPEMDPELRARLWEELRPEVLRLEALLNRSIVPYWAPATHGLQANHRSSYNVRGPN